MIGHLARLSLGLLPLFWLAEAPVQAAASQVSASACQEDQVLERAADTSSYWTACGRPIAPTFTTEAAAAAARCGEPARQAAPGIWKICDVQIPPPPVIRKPLSRLDSPRSVAATAYQPTYCTHWSDGCTVCDRPTILSKPACRLRPLRDGTQCSMHDVQCSGGEFSVLAQYCKQIVSYYMRAKSSGVTFYASKETIRWIFVPGAWRWTAESIGQELEPFEARERFEQLGVTVPVERTQSWKFPESELVCLEPMTVENMFR